MLIKFINLSELLENLIFVINSKIFKLYIKLDNGYHVTVCMSVCKTNHVL